MAPKVELIEGFERSPPSLIDYFRSLVGVNGVDGGDGRDAGVAVAVVAAVGQTIFQNKQITRQLW